MGIMLYGKNTESNPRYIAAVKAQQEQERVRAEQAAKAKTVPVMLMAPSGTAKIVQIAAPTAEFLLATDAKVEIERLNTWLLMAEYNSPKPSAAVILEVIARKHGLTVEDIKGGRKTDPIIACRHDAIVDMHERRPDFSSPEIGRHIGRDHSTVLHALKRRGISSKPRNILNRVKANQLFDEGLTTEEIAKAMGFSVDAIYKATHQARSKTTQYTRNHKKILKVAHLPVPEICAKTGFSKSAVRAHLLRARREGALK